MPNSKAVVTLMVSLVALGSGCASPKRTSFPPQLTSATFATSYRDSEASAKAITTGDYVEALALSDKALAATPDNPWALYDRAVALQHLDRVDESIRAYADAAARFAAKKDATGRGLALYGRAHTLAGAGRCNDANAAYTDYAELVRATDAKAADMAVEYGRSCKPADVTALDPVMTKINTAVLMKDYPQALELTNQATDAAKQSGWVDYNRAIALDGLDRTDDAVASYRAAEKRFVDTGNRHGHEVAVYGRARALDRVKRCAEARQAYQDFAALVRPSDSSAADSALTIERSCAVR